MSPSTTANLNLNFNPPPSSSCDCLKALQKVEMLPERYSQGMASVTSLRKIDVVRIDSFAERDGKLYYVIDVYFQKPESRIPTNIRDSKQQQEFTSSLTGDLGNREPDFQVQRSFSEFSKLRSKIYRLAQSSHSMLRCSFCNDVINSTILGRNQPRRLMNVLLMRNTLARVLTTYLSNLLEMTVHNYKQNNGYRICAGQEQTPQLLLSFLNGDPSSSA